ncbi:hypothetical protein BM536_005060 [Streptomyces phaeoluteigriseus]|uniref:Uncharacterized protein n=1 Tax=Streptomyces phaeoluteigriseus TaxID=114686 RepID=A0A1V6MYE8_9ACTN|nr:hypothetical protein [Streptomyces phaeoluteigriseus]OQD57347.1 hypothetical protein BM536_005060 [Streptomyces phaeoluteigriseus]
MTSAAQKARERFADGLREVRRNAGSPSYSALVKHSGNRRNTTGIGKMLNAQFTAPGDLDFVYAFLSACEAYAKEKKTTIFGKLFDRELWKMRHSQLTEVLELLGEDRPAATPASFRVEPFPLTEGSTRLEAWRDQPSQLLLARHQVVPFTGRGQDLTRLERWRDEGEPAVAVTLLYGPGGRGKTRFGPLWSPGPGWRCPDCGGRARHGPETAHRARRSDSLAGWGRL